MFSVFHFSVFLGSENQIRYNSISVSIEQEGFQATISFFVSKFLYSKREKRKEKKKKKKGGFYVLYPYAPPSFVCDL